MTHIITPITEVIPESRIIIISPHYDDVLFMLGGYISELRKAGGLKNKQFDVKLVFSQSNYQARTGEGNFDTSSKRLKFATGNRLIEDVSCNNALLGEFNYSYELYNELECFARGKDFANSEMEFPHGMFEDFDEKDQKIFDRMIDRLTGLSQSSNTAIILPTAIKEHIDHFIVREAALKVAKGEGVNATFYFQEDKPYGGIATEEELQRLEEFTETNSLESIWYQYHPEEVIKLAFEYYLSQVEEVYKEGIRTRSEFWQNRLGSESGVDRICKFKG